jgi:predicted DNA-binding transcriptional regulator AlpA
MRLLDEQEVADYIGKSVSFVQKLRSTGGGPRYLKIGASVRYRQEDVDAWLSGLERTRVWDFDNKDTFELVGDAAGRVVDKISRPRP